MILLRIESGDVWLKGNEERKWEPGGMDTQAEQDFCQFYFEKTCCFHVNYSQLLPEAAELGCRKLTWGKPWALL